MQNYINVVLFTTIVNKMTTLTKITEEIVSLFHQNGNVPIHLREISRKLNLEGQSITRYLNKLEKEKILVVEREGNLKKYFLKNKDEVYSILSHLDIKKYLKLPVIRKQAIEYFLNSLDEKPIIALLFGSTAKETFTNQSDIDILLIVNTKINTIKAKKYVDSQTAQIINDFQISFNDFQKQLKLKEDPVIESAVKTGYPLTNHITYYRCLKNENI